MAYCALKEKTKKEAEAIKVQALTSVAEDLLPCLWKARDAGDDIEYAGWRWFLTIVETTLGSEMLGHSSVAFTLDGYSHVVGGLQKAAMKRLDGVLKPEITENQDVGKMSAADHDSDTASEEIRTLDRRFTKPLLYP